MDKTDLELLQAANEAFARSRTIQARALKTLAWGNIGLVVVILFLLFSLFNCTRR